jgi:hypothetical protein
MGPTWLPRAGIVGIMAVAGLLRFAALDFGDGLLLARPDEMGILMSLAVLPLGFVTQTLAVYGGGYQIPLRAFLELWAVLPAYPCFDLALERDPHGLLVASRTWSAILSTATVWLTYRAGRRLAGDRVGLLAAALLACAPLAVRDAHFGKPESAAAFAFALALFPLLGAGRGHAFATGAAAGLCAGTKLLVGPLPALAIALRQVPGGGGRLDARKVAGAVGSALGVFLALNFFWLAYPAATWQAVAEWATTYRDIGPSWRTATAPPSWIYHSTVSFPYGCSVGFALLALPALGFALATRGAPRLIALAVLGHLALVLTNRIPLASYVLPCVPALAVLVALLADRVAGAVAPARPWRGTAVWVLAALLGVQPLWGSVQLVRLLGETDTRNLAGAWIAASIPSDARIVSWGSPPGPPEYGLPPLGRRSLHPRLDPARWDAERISFVVWHHYPIPFSDRPLPAAATAKLRRVALFDPFRTPGVEPVTEPLDAFFMPFGRFASVSRPGPRIEILATR